MMQLVYSIVSFFNRIVLLIFGNVCKLDSFYTVPDPYGHDIILDSF